MFERYIFYSPTFQGLSAESSFLNTDAANKSRQVGSYVAASRISMLRQLGLLCRNVLYPYVVTNSIVMPQQVASDATTRSGWDFKARERLARE